MAIEIDHTGRVALVTGAGAGIGREIARWLAAAGAGVAVNDLVPERAAAVAAEIEAAGGRAVAVPADCRDDAAVVAMVAETVDAFGRLDIAVNNVGMMNGHTPAPFLEQSAEVWADLVHQNLLVAASCGRAEARVLREQGEGGVILFVTSGETTRPSLGMAPYGAAKAAVNHLVTTMAVELGPLGIRVNAIAPGTTLTETVRAAFSDEHVAGLVAASPLRRLCESDELARLTVFLASDLARCITGQLILADAGAHLSRTRPAPPS
jgi:3-oxoacyl-[acyl-carrier protein] reductase